MEFRGVVQGVGFRAMVVEIACRRPVAGWVRNEPDGSVRVVVEGGPGDVDALIETIRHRRGPDLKDVRREIIPAGSLNGGASGLLEGFRIKLNPRPDR